jgi:CcmD family protein
VQEAYNDITSVALILSVIWLGVGGYFAYLYLALKKIKAEK